MEVSADCVKFTDFGAVKNTEENTNCASGSELYNLRISLKNKMHQGEKRFYQKLKARLSYLFALKGMREQVFRCNKVTSTWKKKKYLK